MTTASPTHLLQQSLRLVCQRLKPTNLTPHESLELSQAARELAQALESASIAEASPQMSEDGGSIVYAGITWYATPWQAADLPPCQSVSQAAPQGPHLSFTGSEVPLTAQETQSILMRADHGAAEFSAVLHAQDVEMTPNARIQQAYAESTAPGLERLPDGQEVPTFPDTPTTWAPTDNAEVPPLGTRLQNLSPSGKRGALWWELVESADGPIWQAHDDNGPRGGSYRGLHDLTGDRDVLRWGN